MEVKLSKATVTLKDKINWGDTQKVKATMGFAGKVTAESMLESNYVAMECVIIEIKEGNKTKNFTREWVNELSVEDGDKLFEAVQEVSKKVILDNNSLKNQLLGRSARSDIVVMEMLSREYGWTPSQIREMDVEDVQAYCDIIHMRRELSNVNNN